MKITLAQALKEKNRLAGEIARAWTFIQTENSKREDIRRVVDVEETYKKIQLYTEKLTRSSNGRSSTRRRRFWKCASSSRRNATACRTRWTPSM